MGNFFNPEKGIWPWISALVDICGLSILWIFLCIPVATVIPATAALYYAVVKCVRKREPGAFAAFFRSFRNSLKFGGVLASFAAALVGNLLLTGYAIVRWYGTQTGGVAYILYVAYYFVLVVPLGVLCWLGPLLGRFDKNAADLFRTAFQLTVAHLPSTIVVVLLTVQAAAFCIERWWPVLFLPGVVMLLVSLFTERVFQKYAPELGTEEE